MSDEDYPNWVCHDCAIEAGGTPPECATFHIGICGACKKEKSVTEPRDYNYPDFN